MNRAMFSGVAGMKAHQTKMDVIGNNIANVNTYGYKAQRAVFSDIYYQTLRGASGGSSSRGGINPSSVGYGSTLSAVQTQMSQSSMQNTGFGMDVAITGEGFLQVMDPDGNIFYTKAGMLDYDSNGYLTDINGNFVLGSTDVDGRPGKQKIKLDNIGSVDAKQPADTQLINGVNFTVTASNAANSGNVAFNIGSSEALPAGQKAVATISTTGGVTVQLNAFETFSSLAELNSEINAAIIEANGGKQLAAGTFTISADKNLFGNSASNGTFTGKAFAKESTLGPEVFSGLSVKDFKIPEGLTGADTTFKLSYDGTNYKMEATFGSVNYSGTFKPTDKTISMRAASGGGSIDLKVDDGDQFRDVLAGVTTTAGKTATVKSTGPQYFLGGTSISVSNNFRGQGDMTFGCTYNADGSMNITAKTADGKEYKCSDAALGSTAKLVTADGEELYGSISIAIPSKDTMLKNFGLLSTATDTELQSALTASTDYQSYSGVSAKDGKSAPLTGAEIAGGSFGITSGAMTGSDKLFGGHMSFMKTSNDFDGKGTVGPGEVTATYHAPADAEAYWEVAMDINGVIYSGKIAEGTAADSILLKGPDGDYLQVHNPGFDTMSELYSDQTDGAALTDGVTFDGLTGADQMEVAPAENSRQLGLSTVGFALTGGTEGGAITLDQLSSISIGSDGTVTVNHAEKGTVAAGKISLATFSNPSGLQLVGNNYYTTSANSGEAKLADPGTGGTGALKSSALEMSNVDLSSEFADMITTQRGFQANSRIITVSDTMLEELINLKR